MTNPETLHPLAMALLKALEDIQGAATHEGQWVVHVYKDNDGKPRNVEIRIYRKRSSRAWMTIAKHDDPIDFEDSSLANEIIADYRAIATAHNTQQALLAITKGQLENHYDQWQCWGDFDGEYDDADNADYYAKLHHTICQQLCTMSHECPELTALKQAMGGE